MSHSPAADQLVPVTGARYGASWRDAGVVAMTAVLTSGLFAAVVGLGSKQREVSARNTVTFVGSLWTGAFGAGSSVSGRGSIAGLLTVSGDVSVTFVPLTITVVTMAATLGVFRRVTRDRTRARDTLLDALLAALLAAVPMLVVALLVRGGVSGVDLPAGVSLQAGPDPLRAFLCTFATVAVVLGAAVLVRRAHDWVAAPLVAFAWLLALTPVAGAVVALAVLLTGRGPFERLEVGGGGFDARDWLAVTVLVIAYAANVGVWALTLGGVGRLQVGAGGLGQHAVVGHRLTFFTAHPVHEPSLWVCVALTPLLLAASAYVVVRRCRGGTRGGVLRALGLWLAGLVVLVPLMVHASALHLSMRGVGLQPVGGLLTGLIPTLTCPGSGICAYVSPALLQQAKEAADAMSRQQVSTLWGAAGPAMLSTTLLLVGYACLLAGIAGAWTVLRDGAALRGAGPARPRPRPRRAADGRRGSASRPR